MNSGFNEKGGDIKTIDDAKERIINVALKRWLSLPLAGLGLTPEMIEDAFQVTYKLILRNSGQNFRLNVLRTSVKAEAEMVKALPSDRKDEVDSGFPLVLFADLNSKEADFITEDVP